MQTLSILNEPLSIRIVNEKGHTLSSIHIFPVGIATNDKDERAGKLVFMQKKMAKLIADSPHKYQQSNCPVS